jgi:hypothetical protein
VKILLDENAPVDLIPVLRAAGHAAESVNFMGWKGLQNGDLLAKAQAGYDLHTRRYSLASGLLTHKCL